MAKRFLITLDEKISSQERFDLRHDLKKLPGVAKVDEAPDSVHDVLTDIVKLINEHVVQHASRVGAIGSEWYEQDHLPKANALLERIKTMKF